METIVIILVKNNDELVGFGTGFVVAVSDLYSYILTAAHVVNKSDETMLYVRVGSFITPASLLVRGDPASSDYAILQVEGKLNAHIHSLSSTANPKQQIMIVGCHEYDEKSLMIRTLHGYLGESGSLGSMSGGDFVRTWNLEVNKREIGDRLEKGYSGSPVIDVETGKVIAIVSRKHGEGEAGLSIGVDGLLPVWSKQLEREVFSLILVDQVTTSPVYETASSYVNEVNLNHSEQLQHILARILELIRPKYRRTQLKNANMFPVAATQIRDGLVTYQIGSSKKPCVLIHRRGSRGKRPPFYRSASPCWLEATVDIKEALLSVDLLIDDNTVESVQHPMEFSDLERTWLLHFNEKSHSNGEIG